MDVDRWSLCGSSGMKRGSHARHLICTFKGFPRHAHPYRFEINRSNERITVRDPRVPEWGRYVFASFPPPPSLPRCLSSCLSIPQTLQVSVWLALSLESTLIFKMPSGIASLQRLISVLPGLFRTSWAVHEDRPGNQVGQIANRVYGIGMFADGSCKYYVS